MGLGFGTSHALVAMRFPAVRAGYGTHAATGLFAATYLTSLPMAGLQSPPADPPTAWWARVGRAQVIYGGVLDTTSRLLDRAVDVAGVR